MSWLLDQLETNAVAVVGVVVLVHVAVIGALFLVMYSQSPKEKRMARRFADPEFKQD